jgi:hypothetical protein
MGQCVNCTAVFAFNPERVPSVRVKDGKPDPNGIREPLCRPCAERLIEMLKAKNLPWTPIPADAYDAAPEMPDDDY